MKSLESRASKEKKVAQAVGGLAAFVAGWCFDCSIVDDVMIGAGLYLMYQGRDTIQYIRAAYGRREQK